MSNSPSTQPSSPFVAPPSAQTPLSTEIKTGIVQPALSAPKKSWIDIVQPFVIGGLSGCTATCFIQPIDMIKVTIQLKSEEVSNAKKAGLPINADVSPTSAIREIYSTGGIRAFYKGYT